MRWMFQEVLKMSKVEEYMHSRLGDFVNAYTSAVQALADAKEELHNRLFAPEQYLEDIEILEKRVEYLLLDVQHAAMNLSDFVVEHEHDL